MRTLRSRSRRLRRNGAAGLLVGLLTACLTGCVSARYSEGDAIPWAAVEEIVPGTTTRAQVLARMGAPVNFSKPTALTAFLESRGLDSELYSQYPFTDVFVYEQAHARLRLWTVFVYTSAALRIESDLVVLLFDGDLVRHLGTRRARLD